MRKFSISLAPALFALTVLACSKPPEARPDGADGKDAKETKAKGGDKASEEGASSEPQPVEDPPWYGLDLIEHESVTQDSTSESREGGAYSRAILLELAEGTTPADCMDKVAASLEGKLELGDRSEGADGRLESRGEDGIYKLSVVCGKNKDGKPSAYLGLSVEP